LLFDVNSRNGFHRDAAERRTQSGLASFFRQFFIVKGPVERGRYG
jgi:hypothetical protein